MARDCQHSSPYIQHNVWARLGRWVQSLRIFEGFGFKINYAYFEGLGNNLAKYVVLVLFEIIFGFK